MENRNDLRLVLKGRKHLALRRHEIPLNSKEYTKEPATPNDLGMFKFMITFVSCFVLQKGNASKWGMFSKRGAR